MPSVGLKDPADYLESKGSSVVLSPDCRELGGGDDYGGVLVALHLALVGTLERSADDDDPSWAWHLQL